MDLKSSFKWAKYTAVVMTVALVLRMPVKMTARTFVGRAFTGRNAGPETQKTTFKNLQMSKDVSRRS